VAEEEAGVAKALAFQYGNFIKSGIKIKDWNNLPISEINRIFLHKIF